MTDSLFPEPDAFSEPLASVADPVSAEPVSAEPDAPEVSPDVSTQVSPDVATEVSPAEATEDTTAEDLAVAEVPATEEPATDEPATEESVVQEAVAEVTASDEAATDEAATDEAAIEDAAPVAEEAAPTRVEESTEASTPQDAPTEAPATTAPAPAAPTPSPALFARSAGAPATSAFGRVGTDGIVYVTTADGEREVGSYPGVSNAEALAYFGRKYDELAASLQLLHQRVTHTEIPAKEAAETAGKLRAQVAEARVVGDLAALAAQLDDVDAAIVARREADSAARAAAKIVATTQREALVAEAEQISGQPEHKIQWKASGARMRELLDAWKNAQRTGPRLDKDVEAALWHRFSVARNSFDKARRTHFAALDSAHEQAKTTKERLVAEAERMAGSRDWMATAGAFKRLMDDWRAAGRAGRAEDDALWQRFKAAQDTFFTAKDAVVQAEEDSYRANLAVKEALLADAEAILPVTDLEKAKAALRVIQDKWDKAGKVPRADLERTEKAMRRIEQAVRDAEDRRWSASNPEAAARASSLVEQLEKAVASLERDLANAQASGNAKKVAEAEAALTARRQWLDQARSGLAEFGGR